MILRFMMILLCVQSAFASEKYSIISHVDVLVRDSEYMLCTTSGDTGVDCGIFSVKDNKPILMLSTHIKNQDIKNFTTNISDFLFYVKEYYGITITTACFAGPGVPSADQDYLTHIRLPYVIDAKEIIATTGLRTAIIVNDFLAMSYGIDFLDKQRMSTLFDAPAETHGRRVIIGAGAGLGSVSMLWNKERNTYESFPAEAGTGNFPAFSQFEFDLAMGMKQKRNMDTVHWANFVSIPGIQFTYQLLREKLGIKIDLDLSQSDGMSILAHAQEDELSNATADLFYKFYARFTYNVVWTLLPFGGIYLIGDTATAHPKMLQDIFLPEYFNCVISKRPNLKRIPIYSIKDDVSVGLYGTAQYYLTEKKQVIASPTFMSAVQNKVFSFWTQIKENVGLC